jgi:hypothetical protein
MKLTIATQELEMGSRYLGTLRDANGLRNDGDALRARMDEDGYLLFRGLQPEEKVRAARRALLESLAANDQIDTSHPLDEAVVKPGARGGFRGGNKEATRGAAFLDLVESSEIMGFFADFLKGDALTFDYKWLRVVAPGNFTGAHFDIVYMGRGTQNLYTCWTPIGDVPYELGPLALLVGSHRGPAFERVRATYGQMDVDRDKVQGWFSSDPYEMVEKFGGQWQTTEFRAGDVLIFGMYTMHASLTNVSNRFRITADTRYQRADEPVDERWIGANPIAHYAWNTGTPRSMDEARKEWQI